VSRAAGSTSPRLILLRHGEVASHQGDIPLTAEGRRQAEAAGRVMAGQALGSVRLLSGATRRARESALGVRTGLTGADPASPAAGPDVAFALRNPDLYLAGVRVDLVSSSEAFAEQVPWLTAADVLAVPFYAEFLTAPDRIGCWLRHQAPPGDGAAEVARRIVAFAGSLGDQREARPDTVVAVTHSPVLRAVGIGLTGSDSGEPPYLNGFVVEMRPDGSARAVPFDPFGTHPPSRSAAGE